MGIFVSPRTTERSRAFRRSNPRTRWACGRRSLSAQTGAASFPIRTLRTRTSAGHTPPELDLDDPGEPERWLFELGHRREGLGRLPHSRQRRLVGGLDDLRAELRPEAVLLHLHLEAEQALERLVGGAALAVACERLLDAGERCQHLPAERVHDVVGVAFGGGHERLKPSDAKALLGIARVTEDVAHPL